MELLRQFGFKKIEMVDPQYDETNIKKKIPINKLVVELSSFKAKSVSNKLKKFNGFIISGDTEVFRCKEVFSKTNSRAKVREYLSKLSGRRHFVYGGITVISPDGQISKKSVKTGFAKDENNNQIPDAWEKRFKFLFTFENIIILVLGILIGYLFAKSTLLS